jgi:uncharacterized damage-inducible protein DinB
MNAANTTLLDEALEAWSECRAGVVEELKRVPADRIGFRPAPDARSVAEIVTHIVEVAMMWAGELAAEHGDFRRKPFEDLVAEHAGGMNAPDDRDGLVRVLRDSHVEGERRIRAAGELHILQLIRRFDGQTGTRLAWLHHGIAHEMYHRGQLAHYVRSMGIVPALTRRIGG